MRIRHLLENKELPGAGEGILVMSPEEFVQADEEGVDVDPNEIDQKVDEDKPERDANRTWQMINDYERRAKMASGDIRKQHFMRMAQELRNKLPTNDLDEATKLPAQQREFGGQEFQDYMTRIVGTSDVDKKTEKLRQTKKA